MPYNSSQEALKIFNKNVTTLNQTNQRF